MNGDFERNEGMRSQIRAKRRKTNLVLNGLIGLVIILIIIASVIIFGGDDPKDTANDQPNTAEQTATKTGEKSTGKVAEQPAKKQKETEDKNKPKKKTNTEKADKDSEVVKEGGGDANVKRTITNPDWKAVGTSQSAPYSSSDVDWNERVEAIAYALNFDPNNMTIWYLGRGSEANQSIGTVSAKGSQETYRVYLEWQDGEGWKPTKVEELYQNDKK